jgi:hypothetical protein
MTRDLDGLIFSLREGSKSGRFVISIDPPLLDTIESADRLRREADASGSGTSPGRSFAPRAESRLTPREMQARLRAGHTIDEVARAAGVDAEWVERFEAPVAAERSRVIETALAMTSTKARVGDSALPLADSVRVNLHDRGVSQTAAPEGWSALSLDGNRWLVRYEYLSRQRPQRAEWELDFETRTLSPRNRTATELGYVNSTRRRLPPPPPARVPASERNELPPRPLTMARPVIEVEDAEEEETDGISARRTSSRRTAVKKTTAKKTTAKKASAKRAPAKRTAARKSTAKRTAAKKASTRRTAVKKAPAKRSVAKKAPAKRTAAKKASTRRTAVKKAPAKRSVAKKTTAKRSVAKKTTAKRTLPRKTAVRKAATKRTPAKRTPAKRTVAKRTVAKKAPARKATARKATPRKTSARKVAARKTATRKVATRRSAARKTTTRARSGRPRAAGVDNRSNGVVEAAMIEAPTFDAPDIEAPPVVSVPVVSAPAQPTPATVAAPVAEEGDAPDVVIIGRPFARQTPVVPEPRSDDTAQVEAVRPAGWRRFTRPLRSR